MIPCLYDSREMKFDHNGIGKLADAQSCTVTEKRNGSYELKLICPADGIHAEMLEEGNIILAKSSDTMQPQPFRIYKITTPIDGKLEVQARHISYQLNFITVSPFSVTGCVGAMRGLKSHAASDCPFNVWADVESSATFTLGVPSSFRNCLGGMAGSVLDVFGGEFEWDRYTVKFHKARGADHNVHIIYGKNLTDFKMEKSIENTITGVHPYWVDNETQAVMELPEKVVLQSKRSIPYQKITVLDCTSNFQEKPSEAALREYAQNYIDTTDLTEPEIDIKIDFLQLWNTPGYAHRLKKDPATAVKPIPPVGHGHRMAVVLERSQHAQNVLVPDAVFFCNAVVTQNHIAVRAHFNDAVQHIRVRRPAVQYHVIFFAAFRPFWDYGKQVSPLPEHRLHTHAPDAIGQKAILRKTFFQCELTHPAHRFFSGCQAPYPHLRSSQRGMHRTSFP